MQNLVSWETAEKIMGKNAIHLEEALSVFPCPKDLLAGYETIPFSDSLLYYGSEPDNEYVLVPGLFAFGNKKQHPLTIAAIRDRFLISKPNLFRPCQPLEDPTSFVNNYVCLPRWYLLSKKVLDLEAINNFMKNPADWSVDRAVVYIYAWILFAVLRHEEIFSDALIRCSDLYSQLHRTKTCVAFIDQQIALTQHPTSRMVGLVPSIKSYAK